jgi:hypothetical protein
MRSVRRSLLLLVVALTIIALTRFSAVWHDYTLVESSSMVLLGSGLLGLAAAVRRLRHPHRQA